MGNRLTVVAVVAAIALFLLYSSVFVVNERQQAIVLRFGEIVDVKTEPGIYFKAPFGFLELFLPPAYPRSGSALQAYRWPLALRCLPWPMR